MIWFDSLGYLPDTHFDIIYLQLIFELMFLYSWLLLVLNICVLKNYWCSGLPSTGCVLLFIRRIMPRNIIWKGTCKDECLVMYVNISLTPFMICEIWRLNLWHDLPLCNVLKLSYLIFKKIRNALWQPFLRRLNPYSLCGHFCGVRIMRLLTFSKVSGVYSTMGTGPESLETAILI